MRLKSQRGIGLLELMLSLAIIAILLVMATRYFASARQGQQVASAVSLLQAIMAATNNYAIANGNSASSLTGLSQLIKGNYLPAGMSNTGPWGGQVTVSYSSQSGYPAAVSVTIPNVSSSGACAELIAAIKAEVVPGTTPSCAPGSTGFTAILGGG